MIRKHALRSILAIIVFLSVCSIAPPAKELAGAQQPEKAALQKGKSSMRYGRFGKMTTRPGKRDAVVAILLRDIEKAKAVGCDLYVVNLAPDNPDDI
jgi:hypothetical protein